MTSDLQDIPNENRGARIDVMQPPTAPTLTLRTAAAEALLSGALLCADVERGSNQWTTKPSTERFLKALEALREALS